VSGIDAYSAKSAGAVGVGEDGDGGSDSDSGSGSDGDGADDGFFRVTGVAGAATGSVRSADDSAADGDRRSRYGRWLSRGRLALGGLALAAGLALVVAPTGVIGAVESLATEEVRTAAAIVGGFAVVQALIAGALVRARSADPTTVPDPTTDADATDPGAIPGEGLDESLSSYDELTDGERAAVRERLRAAAVTAVAERRSCTRERAAAVVAEGAWTDDPSAAAYLAGRPGDEDAAGADPDPGPTARIPLSARLREWAGAGSSERVRATRAAEAIPRIRPGSMGRADGPDSAVDRREHVEAVR
jgi:hypothetical protein